MPGAEFVDGAYTSMRTVGQKSIFNWSLHVHRLRSSLEAIFGAHALRSAAPDAADFERLLRERVAAVIQRTYDDDGSLREGGSELKVSAHVSVQNGDKLRLVAHAAALPALPSTAVQVEVAGRARANATAKDSAWVAQRKPLEQNRLPASNEILLLGPENEILEGTQTNFFALLDGVWRTASEEEGVLPGSVRDVVLEVCEEDRLELVQRALSLGDLRRVSAAFICSTSRLVLPIRNVVVRQGTDPQHTDEYEVCIPESAALERIKEAVERRVAEKSQQIIA